MALLAEVSTQKLVTSVIQTSNLSILDIYNTPGYVTAGFLTLATSSSQEAYSLAANSFLTGSISSLGLLYTDGMSAEMGPLYLSSLYLGGLGGTTAGQMTTDGTATNLFWNGSQLNNQAGGGGGAIVYISAFTVSTSVVTLSSMMSYDSNEPITIPDAVNFTGKITNSVELNGKGSINLEGTVRGLYYIITSSLGIDDVQFTTADYGTKFVYNTSNFNIVNLPDPALLPSGWNVVIANSRGSTSDLQLYQNCNYVGNLTAGTSVPFCTDTAEYFNF